MNEKTEKGREPVVSSDKPLTEGEVQKRETDFPCPVCGTEGMEMTTAMLRLPYIGECMETTLVCKNCGYKHANTLILSQKEPVRYTLKVEGEKDLWGRVVRSTSGTIRIPELGLTVEPGPASEPFISNIEGVLNRFAEAIGFALRSAESDGEREKALELLNEIENIKKGERGCTVIIEDPLGNSAILDEKAEKEILSREEADKLAMGMYVMDI